MRAIFWCATLGFFIIAAAMNEFPQIPETYKTGFEVKTYWNNRYMIFTGKEARKMNQYSIHFDRFHDDGQQPNKTKADRAPKSVIVLFDYDRKIGRSIEFHGERRKCRRVFNISSENRTIDGINAPIVTLLDLLGKEGERNYSYVGTKMVRHLRCHHWRRNLTNEQVDYYFKENDDGEKVLVRITESNNGYNRHSIYDYFSFTNVLPTVDELNTPMGTYCKVKNPTDPPKLPDKMTLSMEYRPLYGFRNRTYDMVVGFKLYWDPYKQRVRRDHHKRINKKWFPVVTIHDSRNELIYEVFSPNKCNLTQFNPSSESLLPYFKNKRHWIHLEKAIEHYRGNMKDFQYEGQHIVRGVLTDVWIFKSDILGQEGFNEIEWYFTKPNVIEVSSTGLEREKQIPVRMVGYYGNKTKEYFEMDIFEFKHNVDDEDFRQPLKNCLQTKSGAVNQMALVIDGIPLESREKMNDLSSFKNTAMRIIQKAAGLKDDNKLMSEMMLGSDNIMLVLNIIDYPLQKVSPSPPAKDIIKTLENEIRKNSLTFTYKVDSKMHQASIKLPTHSQCPSQLSKRKPKTESGCVKSGITALLVIVFFLIGAILTFIILDQLVRRIGKKSSLIAVIRDKERFSNETSGVGQEEADTNKNNVSTGAKISESQNI